jgi:hypothetical protein
MCEGLTLRERSFQTGRKFLDLDKVMAGFPPAMFGLTLRSQFSQAVVGEVEQGSGRASGKEGPGDETGGRNFLMLWSQPRDKAPTWFPTVFRSHLYDHFRRVTIKQRACTLF